jgi:AraC-like DNA-binding protein
MTSLSLNLVVSAAGVAMGGVVFARRLRVLGVLLAGVATVSAVIALQHAISSSLLIDVLERIEYAISVGAGPLVLLYTRGQVRKRDWIHSIAIVPAVVFLPPIQFVMIHQMSYTAAAARTWQTRRTPWAGTLIASFALIHLAQITRLAFSHVDTLRNIVPTVVSLAILGIALTGFQAAFPRSTQKYARSSRPAISLDSIRARISQERLFADCDLTLASLAQRTGLTPHQLSQLLNESGHPFREFITAFRIRDFCARLSDPSTDRLTIEAIAEGSGFGSRSGLYAAFRRETGKSPVEYRKAARSLSTPNGLDKPDEAHR